MTDTTTNGCALHDTSLPNISLDSGRDVFRSRDDRGRIAASPKHPTLLHLNDVNYLMWKVDGVFVLRPRVHPHGKTPSSVVTIHQGQKIAVGGTYWIVDIVDGAPVLRDC